MPKLFISLPQGRLGNLLFQIGMINSLIDQHNGHALVFASEATDHFDWPNKIWVIPCPPRFRKNGQKLWVLLLNLAQNFRLFASITPKVILTDGFETEESELVVEPGLINNIYLVKGFFQNEALMKSLPRLSRKTLTIAQDQLATIPYDNRVAVHFRFGDYLTWSAYGVPNCILPESFYRQAFQQIERSVANPVYLIFSDESEQARQIMFRSDRPFVLLSDMALIDDFAAMTLCSHFIVSASTFSWWAAKLAERSDKIIIAPQYWLGFKSEKWYPKNIQSREFSYLPVTPNNGSDAT